MEVVIVMKAINKARYFFVIRHLFNACTVYFLGKVLSVFVGLLVSIMIE